MTKNSYLLMNLFFGCFFLMLFFHADIVSADDGVRGDRTYKALPKDVIFDVSSTLIESPVIRNILDDKFKYLPEDFRLEDIVVEENGEELHYNFSGATVNYLGIFPPDNYIEMVNYRSTAHLADRAVLIIGCAL